MVDVFDEEEHLDDIGGAVQVKLMDVGLVSHTALVVASGKQGGSHNLPRRSKYEWISHLKQQPVDVTHTGGSWPLLVHQSTCARTMPSDQTSPKTGA